MTAAAPAVGLELFGTSQVGNLGRTGPGWSSMRGTAQLLHSGFVAEAGTFGFTLDNQDRAFDPLRTTSPYYPNVQPDADALAYVTWDSNAYNLLKGKVEDFPQVYPNSGTKRGGTVPIRVVDAIGQLNGTSLYVHPTAPGAMRPRLAERSGARINAILDAAGWTGPRDIADGNSIVTPLDVGAVSVWSHLQNIGMAEWGELFIDTNNGVVFRSRDNIASLGNTPVAVYGDKPSYQFPCSNIERTTMPCVNDCTITYGNRGYQVNAQDSVSIAFRGVRSKPLTLPLHTATQAQQYANWMVARYKDPVYTFSSVEFLPNTNDDASTLARFTEVLSRNISDLVTVEMDPIDDGIDTISLPLWIRGIGHQFDNGIWKKSKFWLQDARWITGLFHLDVDTIETGGTGMVLAF